MLMHYILGEIPIVRTYHLGFEDLLKTEKVMSNISENKGERQERRVLSPRSFVDLASNPSSSCLPTATTFVAQ